MNNKHRMPILIAPGQGPIIFPPQDGLGPVMPPPWNNPGGGGIPNFPPLPEKPENKDKLVIVIKSVFNNSFVQVGPNGYLYARGLYYNDGEVFTMILLDKNQVKIRVKGGNFISLDEREFLVANTDKKGASIFNVFSINRNEYVLMAPNGYYVRVREKDSMLVARAEQAGPRTIFKFRKMEN